MAQLEVVKEVSGQRVYFYPQEGRPSATPTVGIKDKYGNTISAAADTNVTLDTVNTTIASAVSVGDTSITLTSATGVQVGKSYLLTNALSQKEWIRVRSVNSSTKVIETHEPIELAHATANFQGCFFYYTLQSNDVSELVDNYRARATYIVDGLTYTVDIPFDVVLTPLLNPLSRDYVVKHRPDIMSQQHQETLGDDLLDLREMAFERVKEKIRAHSTGWRPALLKTPDDLNQWALAEFDMLCIENGIDVYRNLEPIDQFEKADERRNKLASFAMSSLTFMDLDDDDSLDEGEEQPLRMDLLR